jgi:hypothetical protein
MDLNTIRSTTTTYSTSQQGRGLQHVWTHRNGVLWYCIGYAYNML